MKIGIVGLGVVGSACKYGFEKLGHTVKVYDIKIENSVIKDVLNTEIVYVTVPTPSQEDGSCDTSIVETVVKSLIELKYKGVIAIKSTVEPGTTQRLIDMYQDKDTKLKKRFFFADICFVPEFLRERCAVSDFTENHDLLAVGTTNNKVYDIVLKSHGKYPRSVVKLSPTEAELLKYFNNVLNATKIVFANEFYEVCQKLNANYTDIKNAFIKRGTEVDMYLDVNENFRGYGGACLVKDTKALAQLTNKLNLQFNLFETIDLENKKFKTTVLPGMREN